MVREGYGRLKRNEREVEALKGREVGEIGGNCKTMLNVGSQEKKGWESGVFMGVGRLRPPCPGRFPRLLLVKTSKRKIEVREATRTNTLQLKL